MFKSINSAAVYGIEARIIRVEADVSDGLPVFNMVGFLSSEVRESKDRVRTALRNSNFALKPKRITINLSPADIRKCGTAFDLPIALSVLAASSVIPTDKLDDSLVVGELGLEGSIKAVFGVLPIVLAAKEAGFKRCIVPADNACEGAVVKGIDVIGVSDIIQLVDYLYDEEDIEPTYVDTKSMFTVSEGRGCDDFADISGQETAKRAIEIAVSGRHNIIMSGPPGAGKTMIARRVPGIMPSLSFEESMELSRIYSIAGKLDAERFLVTERPFIAPHHSATVPSVIGGGRFASPGAVSLSHNGVLFLDELPEFSRDVIESLRQPLEDRTVNVMRLNGAYTYPAGFMLVASMNPCPCGYLMSKERCTCSPNQILNYRRKISRPILDRIDLFINVNEIQYSDLSEHKPGETSAEIRKRVEETRAIQYERYKGLDICFNAQLSGNMLEEFCQLGDAERKLMEEAYERLKLSARGYHRILRVARTIADMDRSERINVEHLAEALGYRDYTGDEEVR